MDRVRHGPRQELYDILYQAQLARACQKELSAMAAYQIRSSLESLAASRALLSPLLCGFSAAEALHPKR